MLPCNTENWLTSGIYSRKMESAAKTSKLDLQFSCTNKSMHKSLLTWSISSCVENAKKCFICVLSSGIVWYTKQQFNNVRALQSKINILHCMECHVFCTHNLVQHLVNRPVLFSIFKTVHCTLLWIPTPKQKRTFSYNLQLQVDHCTREFNIHGWQWTEKKFGKLKNKWFVSLKMRTKQERAITWWNPAAQMCPVLDSSSFLTIPMLPPNLPPFCF